MKKLAFILGIAFLVGGCGQDDPPESDASAQAAAEQTQSNRNVVRRSERQDRSALMSERDTSRSSASGDDASRRIPKLEGEAGEGEGFGLTIPVDGSSPEAFRDSLEMIAADSSKEEFNNLDSALRYLSTYDTAAWQGLSNLYLTLDGMSGEEIIKRAGELREKKGRR